jgi:hypothetical protein
MTANRQELLAKLHTFVDDTLNISGPAKGPADGEFATQIREIARLRATQSLDEIARTTNNPPTDNFNY